MDFTKIIGERSFNPDAIIMTLWIGNSAVLKSSSQWQLKEF